MILRDTLSQVLEKHVHSAPVRRKILTEVLGINVMEKGIELFKAKELFFKEFVERLWGALWKDHSTPNMAVTGPECHNSKRELLLDVQELARQLSKEV